MLLHALGEMSGVTSLRETNVLTLSLGLKGGGGAETDEPKPTHARDRLPTD